jgi:hypothetical protein
MDQAFYESVEIVDFGASAAFVAQRLRKSVSVLSKQIFEGIYMPRHSDTSSAEKNV